MPKKTTKPTPREEEVEEVVEEAPKKKINKALIHKEVAKRQKSMHPLHVEQALNEVLEEMGLTRADFDEL